MGILDSIIGGDKPVKREATGAERRLVGASRGLLSSSARAGYTNLRDLAYRAAGSDRTARRANVLGTATADVQQATAGTPTTQTGAVERALTRARGLSRIARATSDQFDTLQMRERLGVAREARGRQGIGLATLADVAGLREGISGAQHGLDATRRGIRSNTAGTIVGLGLGAIPDIRRVISNRRMDNSQIGGTGAGGGYTGRDTMSPRTRMEG